MKKITTFLLVALLTFHTAKAQTFIKYWDKTYGGNNLERAFNLTYDGGAQMVLIGNSLSDTSGDKTDPLCNPIAGSSNIWLLKVDTALNILWQNNLGSDVIEGWPHLIHNTITNRYIFSCQSISDSACDKTEHTRGDVDIWICYLDSAGIKIWDKTLGSASADNLPNITQLASGDLIVSCYANSPPSGDKTAVGHGSYDFWTIKFDTLGNKIWDYCYGGSGIDQFHACAAIPGNSFVLTGYTLSPVSGDVTDTSRGLGDVWIIKIDSAGNKIWDKRYGGSGNEKCYSIKNTPDKGFVLCGYTSSLQGGDITDAPRGFQDYWILKLDSLGNKQWDKRYGGYSDNIANWIELSLDGGYWVAGYTNSDSSLDVSEPTYGDADYWILKLDSSGNKIWDKRFGGPGLDYATSFVYMPDSSIVLYGYADTGTSAMKTDWGKGSSDYWMVRFKYTDNTTGINENPVENNSVSIYPNPSKDILYISTKNNFKPNEISLYDAAGKKVLQKELSGAASFSIKELHAGIYFYEIKDAKGNAGRGKVVRE